MLVGDQQLAAKIPEHAEETRLVAVIALARGEFQLGDDIDAQDTLPVSGSMIGKAPAGRQAALKARPACARACSASRRIDSLSSISERRRLVLMVPVGTP